jgi:type IV pilus assembly protein PilM
MSTMANQPGVWGIDLGQCALKAVRLEVVDGQITATAFDYVEHPKILSQPDADPDQLTREALEKFLSRNTLKGDVVAISVPGQSGLARFVKLPPVEEKKINDIVKFEAKQQIPFPLEEVVWDYQKIGSGAVTDGFAMETEIGLFAIKRDMVSRSLQHFKDVGVEVHVVQMSPLALCNFVAFDLLGKGVPEIKKEEDDKQKAKDKTTEGNGETEKAEEKAAEEEEQEEEEKGKAEDDGKRHCVVALDIGSDNSNLVITDAEKIIWQRPIPIGGNHFTRALTKDLKLTFAKAEHLKRNATKSPELRKILASLKPVLNDFAGEIQRSLGYFTNTHRAAHIDYMVGLGSAFRLPGLQKFLSEKLQLDVRKYQKPEHLNGDGVMTAPSFTENVLSFGVAYGLAVQGLKLGKLQTNLLPHELHVERLVRAKKPWAAAAGALLLFGVVGLMIGYAKEHHAVDITTDPLKKDMDAGKSAATDVTNWKNQCQNKEQEIARNILAVKSIIAGQDEQFNWLHLNPLISECLPRYDGGDLRGLYVPTIYGKVTKVDSKEITIKGRSAFGQEGPVYHCKIDPQFKITARDETGKTPKPITVKDIKEGDEVRVLAVYQNVKAGKYWTDPAKAAMEAFETRQGKPKETSSVRQDEGIDDLVQVNLEAVMPRYCDDLSKVVLYTNLEGNNRKTLLAKGLPEEALKNPPKGPGWVVELRGYTYQKRQNLFLIDTLVAKLNSFRAPDQELWLAEVARIPAGSAPISDDPIDGRISHALLFDYYPVKNPEPGKFELLNNSFVKDAVAPGRGSDWSPLSGGTTVGAGNRAPGAGARGPVMGSGSGSSSSSAAGPVLQPGMEGAMHRPNPSNRSNSRGSSSGPIPPPGMGSMPGMPGTPGGPGGQPGNEPAAAPSGSHTRTEFVIFFIWKEPTPSDKLLGTEAPAGGAGGNRSGPIPQPGMGGPGMGGPGGGQRGPTGGGSSSNSSL